MTPEPGTGPAAFDPFELPDTIQLWTADDPYPHLAAASVLSPLSRTDGRPFHWALLRLVG